MARIQHRFGAFALAAVLAAALPAAAHAEPGEIKGQDVKGDSDKSANDGFSQAPVPREESAGKDAENPGGQSTRENAERPVPNAGSSDNSGSDPQKPLEQRAPGPSGQNPDAPSKSRKSRQD